MLKIIFESDCLMLKYQSPTIADTYELRRVILGETKKGSNFQTIIYSYYRNGLLQWVESTQGAALQRFMSIIPNEIGDQIQKLQ